jgi:hypothetical protein
MKESRIGAGYAIVVTAVGLRQIIFATLLMALLAISCAAQDGEIATSKVAAGYANLHLPFNRINIDGRFSSTSTDRDSTLGRSGLWMQLEWNPVPWLGVENYTGMYHFADNSALFSIIPGAKLVASNLLGGQLKPYAVAGFGLGVFREPSSFFGGGRNYSISAAGRYGFGTDVQLNRSWGLRVDASRMAINFTRWTTGWNLAGGVVYSRF